MATAKEKILANTFDFMVNNVVVPPEGGNFFAMSGKKSVGFKKHSQTAHHKDRSEGAGREVRVPIYHLVPSSMAEGGSFDADWVPYKDNKLCSGNDRPEAMCPPRAAKKTGSAER